MPAFVDEAQIHVKGGDGGAGAVSFRREAHVDRGGPDGGDGGRGGDVWLVAATNQSSLLGFRDHPHRRAGDGGHGGGKRRHGANGKDLEVPVPVGTRVMDGAGVVLADLLAEGDRWMAAPGGRGGRGNASFLSNRRRAPSFAEQGEQGHEQWYDVELALVADVALVGFPNAGKSTLISRISAAKPKIADYPFTTLEPHLGVVRAPGGGDFTVADIPGLVEGAADGKGLGHRFLRHVTRARVLLVLVTSDPAVGTGVEDQERVLLDELRRYRPELLDRPRIVIRSKSDLDVPEPLAGQPAGPGATGGTAGGVRMAISAVTGAGVDRLVGTVATIVDEERRVLEARAGRQAIVIHRPLPEGFTVDRRDDGTFEVVGRTVERVVSLNDVTGDEAADYVQGRLRRLGVDRALVRAGARDGDVVHIGALSFVWYRDQPDFVGEAPARRPRR
ncbi:MAG: GTPase ObgE [Acidimicrobiales bacterium]|jgi:GTP-binding protein